MISKIDLEEKRKGIFPAHVIQYMYIDNIEVSNNK